MLIDWFTIIAQIINFLILLFLLHRFLYQPILQTIDKRQQHMEDRWDAAEEARADAAAAAEEHRQAQRELEDKREHILAQAREEAEADRRDRMQAARDEIAQQRQEWQQSLEEEQRSLVADLQYQFGQKVIGIVRRLLTDLANVDLEQQTVTAFQSKLHHLDADNRRAIAQALAQQDQAVTIQTSQELPPDSQDALRQTLHDTQLVNGQGVRFAVVPDLLLGIRLQTDAYDLSWNARDYLQALAGAIQGEDE